MIKWYSKNNLTINFDVTPDIKERFIIPTMTQDEKDDVKKFPYILCNDVTVFIAYFGKNYSFTIKKDFKWDGATIPKAVWSIIGSSTDNCYLIGSLVHDVLCENHNYIDNNRLLSTKVFCACCEVAEVNPEDIFLIFLSVDNYQKLKGNWNNEHF